MANRIGGSRKKTRTKYSLHKRERGKFSIRSYMTEYKEGEQVVLKPAPQMLETGGFHAKFVGKNAKVVSKRGRCYEVELKDGSVKKTLLVHPVHLKRC